MGGCKKPRQLNGWIKRVRGRCSFSHCRLIWDAYRGVDHVQRIVIIIMCTSKWILQYCRCHMTEVSNPLEAIENISAQMR